MGYDEDYKRNVLNRWKSIEGHVAAVRRMLEAESYCPDVLRQSLAVQGAIDRVNALVLENHLYSCASQVFRDDDAAARERVIAQQLELFAGRWKVTWSRQLPPFGEAPPAESAR